MNRITLLALVLCLAGCNLDDKLGAASTSNATLVSLYINPDPASVEIGNTIVLACFGRYSDGSTGVIDPVWSSSDPSIADSSIPFQSGGFIGTGTGSAVIRAELPTDSTIFAATWITVSPQGAPLPTITTVHLPAATVGVPYSTGIAYINGSGTPAWDVSSGTLPAGFTLDLVTGVFSGTAAATFDTAFTIRVTDTAGSDTQDYLFSAIP